MPLRQLRQGQQRPPHALVSENVRWRRQALFPPESEKVRGEGSHGALTRPVAQWAQVSAQAQDSYLFVTIFHCATGMSPDMTFCA
jgi:hypothetical protein